MTCSVCFVIVPSSLCSDPSDVVASVASWVNVMCVIKSLLSG